MEVKITVWNFRRVMEDPIHVHLPVTVDIKDSASAIQKVRKYIPDMVRLLQGAEPEEFDTKTLYIHNSPCTMCEYDKLCYEGSTEGIIVEFERKNFEILTLSPSSVITYETCPRQWAYSYLGYRYSIRNASLFFGDAIHHMVYSYLKGKDPVEAFTEYFGEQKRPDLKYTKKEPHRVLLQKGIHIAKSLKKSDLYIKKYHSFEIEKTVIEDENSNDVKVRYKVKPDLVFSNENEILIVEIKSSFNSVYTERWIRRSDQLLWYAHFVGRKIKQDKTMIEEVVNV
jgi:hypothetical protein